MTKHHEGAALQALLTAHGKTQIDLARKAGKSAAAVTKYVNAETLGDGPWLIVREALRAMNLPTESIRPEPTIMGRERLAPSRDLTPGLDAWPKEHLRQLRDILLATDAERDRLSWWLKGKLGV